MNEHDGEFNKFLKNARYQTRVFLGRTPMGLWALRLIPSYRARGVHKDTEICIEGFPRSGNSFFVNVFRLWNPGVRIAHHLHVPAQVLQAVRYGIPCVVLIRQPVDALASLLIIDERLSLSIAVQSYVDFYRRILPVRSCVVIADFTEVTEYPEDVIQRVNIKFHRSFHHQRLTEGIKQDVFEQLKNHHGTSQQPFYQVPVPLAEKQDRKALLIPKIRKFPRIHEAIHLYHLVLHNRGMRA